MEDRNLDVDQFRSPHESRKEWHLRREFLLAHRDKFPVDRLLCLASCYINVECYGNRYPDPVMRQLRELKLDLPQPGRTQYGKNDTHEKRTAYYQRNEVKFVKSTEESGSSLSMTKVPSGSAEPTIIAESSEASQLRYAGVGPETSHDTYKPVSVMSAKAQPEPSSGQGSLASKFTALTNCSDTGKDCQPSASQVQQTSQSGQESSALTHVKASSLLEADKPVTSGDAQSALTGKVGQECSGDGAKLGFRNELQKYKLAEQEQQAAEQLEKFYELSKQVRATHSKGKNAVEVLYMAIGKSRMIVNPVISMEVTGNYKCHLQIDCVTISVGRAANKKAAKHDAFQRAIELLWKRYLHVNTEDPDSPCLESADRPFHGSVRNSKQTDLVHSLPNVTGEKSKQNEVAGECERRKRKAETELSEFFIVEHQDTENAICIVHNSASVNKWQVEMEFLDHGLKTRCQLHMGSQLIADEMADGKAEAKSKAYEKGLEFLRTACWTIRTKRNEGMDKTDVTPDQLVASIQNDVENSKISNSNIGSKLLKKMGWTGGGLGKEGNEGIVEPIMSGDVVSRAGLGLRAEQGISPQFLPRIRQAIQDYCCSDSEDDLVFSPLFSKEERVIIHSEAQKMNLKSQSRGQGSERYVILSRRRTIAQLFSHILKNGGETSKYVLVPPLRQNS